MFADQPDEANQQQWVPIEDILAELTPGFFALFHLAYETLLWGRKMRTIGPVPAKCAALLEQELTDELGDAVKEFVLVRLEWATRLTKTSVTLEITCLACPTCLTCLSRTSLAPGIVSEPVLRVVGRASTKGRWASQY